MKYMTVLILLMVISTMFAQEYHWTDVYSIGGSFDDFGKDVAIDNLGNIYFTGMYKDSVAFGASTFVSHGDTDIFVVKYDNQGNLIWAQTAGGTEWDEVTDIKVNQNGEVYICGGVKQNCYFGNYYLQGNTQFDIFVAKMTIDGQWDWVESTGSSGMDAAYDLELDSNGNIYLTGYFMNTVYFGTHQVVSNGEYDIFVAKLDANRTFVWAESAGGNNCDTGFSIAIKENDSTQEPDILVAGHFRHNSSFGQYQSAAVGEFDMFYAKVSGSNGWEWVKTAGSTERDYIYGIEFDSYANIYVAGGFHDSLAFENEYLLSDGFYDAYVMKLDQTGNYLWSRTINGLGYEQIYTITVDDQDDVYAVGYAGANASVADSIPALISNNQGFIVKYDSEGSVKTFKIVDPFDSSVSNISGRLTCRGIDVNSDGIVAIAGTTEGDTFFDSNLINSSGGFDAFCSILRQSPTIFEEDDLNFSGKTLYANYPNPFNPETKIDYSIPADGNVTLEIFNIKGQRILTLVDKIESEGKHSVIWNGKDQSGANCSSGVYFYRLTNGSKIETRKMIMMK